MSAKNIARIRSWLFQSALPYWSSCGEDDVHGGPFEQVTLEGHASDPGFKRVRVFCRQLYVYSHAHMMGWTPGLELASNMYNAMIDCTWQGDERGFAKTVRSDNSVLDPTLDLYDNSFALFSLGWYYKIQPNAVVLDYMLKTASIIDTQLRHPKIGFWHQIPPIGPRIQNPHMHLLEACLACFEATKQPIFERLAREVIQLFQTRFYNRAAQTLCEFFDDDLLPLPCEKGSILEPGHQMEWAWILSQASQLFSLEVSSDAKGLVEFSESFGVDPDSGATYNSILIDGSGVDLGSRTWPNTERLKAAVAMFELFGKDPAPIFDATLDLMFERYLEHAFDGGWMDAYDQNGQPIAKVVPTSTLYHIFLAFSEVLRVLEAMPQTASDIN